MLQYPAPLEVREDLRATVLRDLNDFHEQERLEQSCMAYTGGVAYTADKVVM